jgi:hypothetical protein
MQIKAAKTQPRKTFLRVTTDQIEVCDRKNGMILHSSPIAETVFCGVHPTDKRTFAYTTLSVVGLLYCHLFQVKIQMPELMRAFRETFDIVKTLPPLPPPIPLRADLSFFDGFYMGFVKVTEYTGRPVVQEAVTKVWAERKKIKGVAKASIMEGQPITLLITPQQIRALDRLSVGWRCLVDPRPSPARLLTPPPSCIIYYRTKRLPRISSAQSPLRARLDPTAIWRCLATSAMMNVSGS